MIAYQKLLNWPFPEIEHQLTKRDTMLYALSVGFGADPLDRGQLRYVYEKDLVAVPSMASTLCYPGNWLRNPDTGVDYRRMVNGGTQFCIHAALPVEGTLVCKPRVLEIVDKGPGKGAIVVTERSVHEKFSGKPVCTVTTTSVCRGDGGFGGPERAVATPTPVPGTPPDTSIEIATARNLALLYRLNGDQNPLHADPEVARSAGYAQPILHGLATLGVATHALLKACCEYDAARLAAVDVRYTAPVIPGDLIRVDIWRGSAGVLFRAVVPLRNSVVLDYGQCTAFIENFCPIERGVLAMPVALTAGLGEFVARLHYRDIPKDAIEVIHSGFADCVGVMMVGAGEPAPRILKSILAPSGDEATIWFSGGRTSALDAAWINATAGHALDYDDVALRGHPSVVLVPAILAEAEATGASGEQMVLAYAAGYEVWADLVWRDPDHHHNKGWHPTGIFGAIAAAAACASLRKLDAGQAANAIGTGACQSAGLVVNFGAMAKPFQAGRAAHAGVASARLAEKGFTAALDSLEHPPGFLAAVSPKGRFDVDTPSSAGAKWRLLVDRLSIKKYPLCFAVHCALDGIFDLVKANAINAQDVARVTVKVNRRHSVVLRNHAPQTALEAKFSMEFAMACVLIAGRAGLDQLRDEFVLRPDVQDLMKRVVVVPDEEDPAHPGFALDDRVVVETTDGRRLDSGRLTQIRGGPESPLQREELWQKFEDCAKVGQVTVPARPLFDALMSLDQLPHVGKLPGLAT